jgi:hypothetical protein
MSMFLEQDLINKIGSSVVKEEDALKDLLKLIRKMRDLPSLEFILHNYNQEPTEWGLKVKEAVIAAIMKRMQMVKFAPTSNDIRSYLYETFKNHGNDDGLSDAEISEMPGKIYSDLTLMKDEDQLREYYRDMYKKYPRSMRDYFKRLTGHADLHRKNSGDSK